MSWLICLPATPPAFVDGKLLNNPKMVCFEIPQLVRHFPPDSTPPPWIRSKLLNKDFARDLQRLAAIDELASGLSPGLKSKVQSLVRGAAKELKTLPAHFELNFDMH